MKTLILSDLHFGVHDSRLREGKERTIEDLVKWITNDVKADVLVLAGDILDFSLCSYRDTFRAARLFFPRLAASNRPPSQVVYIPGNHDKNVWDLFLEHTIVIRPFQAGKEIPAPLPRAAVVRLDLARGQAELHYPNRGFTAGDFKNNMLAGLYKNPETNPNNKSISTIMAYPNLYLVGNGRTHLVTHGHFFQIPWSLVSFLWWQELKKNRKEKEGTPEFLTIEEIEGVNSPITRMVWTSMGQVPEIRLTMGTVYEQLTNGITTELKRLVDVAAKNIDENWLEPEPDQRFKRLREAAYDAGIYAGKKALKISFRFVSKLADKKHQVNPFKDHVNRWLTDQYLLASAELYRRCSGNGEEVAFKELFFGHTHRCFANRHDATILADWQQDIGFRNCGGWLVDSKPLGFVVDGQGNVTSVTAPFI